MKNTEIDKYKRALKTCQEQRNFYLKKYKEEWSVPGVDCSDEIKASDAELDLILNEKEQIDSDDDFFDCMDIYSPEGSKVIFLGKNGMEGDVEKALKYLTPGQEYTISYTEVHNWNTDVYLEEFPEKAFTSVMFKNKK